MNTANKLALAGIIVTTIGVLVAILQYSNGQEAMTTYSFHEENNHNKIYFKENNGDNNTQIGVVEGDVIINKKNKKANKKFYSDWSFTFIKTPKGTRFCSISSMVINEDIGQNIFIKGNRKTEEVFIHLYKDKWSFKKGEKIDIMFDFLNNQPLSLVSHGDGHVLQVKIPAEILAIFLLELVEQPALQIIFPNDEKERSWLIKSDGAKEAVMTFSSCLLHPGMPSAVLLDKGVEIIP